MEESLQEQINATQAEEDKVNNLTKAKKKLEETLHDVILILYSHSFISLYTIQCSWSLCTLLCLDYSLQLYVCRVNWHSGEGTFTELSIKGSLSFTCELLEVRALPFHPTLTGYFEQSWL